MRSEAAPDWFLLESAQARLPRQDLPAHRVPGDVVGVCSGTVVTALSPSRNSVSSEYMTALMASVALRKSAIARETRYACAPPARRSDRTTTSLTGRLDETPLC